MLIHVISDSATKLAGVRAVLERRHAGTSELLGGLSIQRGSIRALVVKVDLQSIEAICALKKILASLSRVQKRIFLVENAGHLAVSQAYALGATSVLSSPVTPVKLLKEVDDQLAGDEDRPTADPGSSEAAAEGGEVALASMFSAIAAGMPIDIANIRNAGAQIAAAIEEHGLAQWLATVRRHHEGTYQHCLLVTGVTVDFGLSLGAPSADLERLYMAAMFHDIGKAKIPLEILDKPGRLGREERDLVETHPAVGFDALQFNAAISPEILDAVRHH